MLKAIPTVILLIALYWYFRAMLFSPLERVLKQRDELTEGARRAAQKCFDLAERRQQEYEQKFEAARAEVYRAQEEMRRGWLEQQAAQIAEAKERSAETVRRAKEQIGAEAVAARANLIETSAALAEQIADSILERRAGTAL